ncbi:MAG: hypothetical protein M0R77_20590 [Gammaproteobacteria bacterium]|nr:hypothetical protein [Gammaproteobacteria bacterium]
MTKPYKIMQIASNDDIEYFGRSLSKSMNVELPRLLMLSEVEAILSKMHNNKVQVSSIVKDTIEERYIVFQDELTYCEFMLLV